MPDFINNLKLKTESPFKYKAGVIEFDIVTIDIFNTLIAVSGSVYVQIAF